jgi:tRNA1Val (adenine37-N6)-methyltransferase
MAKCWKCKGTGLKPVKKAHKHLMMPCTVCTRQTTKSTKRRPYRPFKRTADWKPVGPKALFDMYDERIAPKEQEFLSSLCGNWMIYQLEHGHRVTTDDIVAAYVAITNAPSVESYLDIGTGLGSVLTIVNWAFHGRIQRSFGIEAQEIHVELARRTIDINGTNATIVHYDLRDMPLSSIKQEFDLITGTPPYFPTDNGVLPQNLGRGMCAFEIRGGIEVYCKCASLYLKKHSESRFIVAQTSLEIERSEKAGYDVGFEIVKRFDIHGIIGKPSLFSVFVFKWGQSISKYPVTTIYVRGSDGQFTKEMKDIYETIGKPPPQYEKSTVPKVIYV